MKQTFTILLLFCAFTFSNCGGDNHKNTSTDNLSEGITIGGILRINEVENIKSLLPIAINEINSYHIASQVYEGLVKYDQATLQILPALAKNWEISENQKKYTFHLRTNAKFQDDPCFASGKGRAVNAGDVLFCFQNLCTRNVNNTQYEVTFKDRVEGANDFFERFKTSKTKTLSGIVIEDDSTVAINLVNPDPNFLNILTMPGCYIYPKEAELKYGNDMRTKCVGTGPFFIETMKEGEFIVMKKNPNYWGRDKQGTQLPYLDGIKWSFIHDKKSEILEFKRGNLDMVYRIPVELFHEFMGDLETAKQNKNDFQILSSPALSTHYLGFDLQTNPFFSIKEIRQAFNLAIDRHKIADFTIQGEGSSADYGIVPYTTEFEKNGYDYKSIKGFSYNPDSAKHLMSIAGYPDGKGLPEFNLEINSGGGDRNILVAEVIQKMLKENIGVNININTVQWPEHINNMQSGKSDFFRYAWVSDYPDPESFLNLFYGQNVPENYQDKSYINFSRFKSAKFDILFMAARLEPDKAKRYKLLSQAEQVVLNEAAIMPIFYDENYRLEQNNVRNLPENLLNYMDFSNTYLITSKK
jgi:peptide/nickel transport system substrate-binding protein